MNKSKSKKSSGIKKRLLKKPRKWSEEYCKKTSCKKMGFSQRASCRYYKNCYKKSPKKVKSNQLIKRGGKKTKSDKIKNCKQRKISQVIREFKSKSLKLRNKKVVTNPKQAIAIALSIASKKCENKK
jgi:hypothetical protein